MGVEPKIRVFTPQIMNFNRGFHYFYHPFWGTPIFGNTHMVYLPTYILVEFYGNCKEKYDTQIILSVKGDWLNVVEDCLNIIEYRSSS